MKSAGSVLDPVCMQPELSSSADNLTLTDAALYNAMRAGQRYALGQLYARHAALVYGLALKVLGDTQEAEDLTQDIFLTLSRTDSYNPQRGSLRTYLAILTRSRAIDRVRSRKTATNLLSRFNSSNEQDAANSPMDYVFEQEQTQEVRAALAQLSEHQQEVLRKAYYEGMTQAKIAEQLDLPLGTVKARARQGLIKLRQVLQAQESESP
ncbi:MULTISPECIES: sigma-70 family RNA polymerase sigma factor [unclassified Leptolyngbya]|uniref:sigma-70 family RNA polymerase sigma factor n=2 Tax=Leptolyngbya TaxID=47251 RepID=UPI001F54CF35|nr:MULTISPECIES: sigma-70 family RNA polymerase sigma factor [unclassified Leptolyngbya]